MTFNIEEINNRLKTSLQKSNIMTDIKSPVLKCIVTGKQRMTNNDYLQTKLKKFGSINTYTANYICSEALKVFKKSETLGDALAKLNINNCDVDGAKILSALEFYNVKY